MQGEQNESNVERQKDEKNKLQRGEIEPPTSAALKPRHNQLGLDHLCLSPSIVVIAVCDCYIVAKIEAPSHFLRFSLLLHVCIDLDYMESL